MRPQDAICAREDRTRGVRPKRLVTPGRDSSFLARARTEFHPSTIRYLLEAPLARRKGLGQYFTPRTVRERLFDLLPKLPYRRVLDPACGTGEFLATAAERLPRASIVGWEVDPNLVSIARRVAPAAHVVHRDALEEIPEETAFDLVVGNPPYFEFNPTDVVRSRFAHVLSGRANVFSLFFDVGLSLLRKGGVLAYVVPQSMNNGAYFRELRRFILSRGHVLALEPIEEMDFFLDAQQTVMLLVVRKGEGRSRCVFERGDFVLFSPDARRLEEAFERKRTLGELGFAVRTGRIVWNQHKEDLTRDPKAGFPLLWSHNLGAQGLRFPVDHPKRPQYVRAPDPDIGPAILVNRVTGASSRATLRAAVVPAGMQFFGENHVNVVFPGSSPRIDLERIAAAIRSPEATAAARLVTGNTQVSATELASLVPLYPIS
jgi:adenine-specific DNA-methyltransferase